MDLSKILHLTIPYMEIYLHEDELENFLLYLHFYYILYLPYILLCHRIIHFFPLKYYQNIYQNAHSSNNFHFHFLFPLYNRLFHSNLNFQQFHQSYLQLEYVLLYFLYPLYRSLYVFSFHRMYVQSPSYPHICNHLRTHLK